MIFSCKFLKASVFSYSDAKVEVRTVSRLLGINNLAKAYIRAREQYVPSMLDVSAKGMVADSRDPMQIEARLTTTLQHHGLENVLAVSYPPLGPTDNSDLD